MIVNRFHNVSKECHSVLNKVINCTTFIEYYERLTSGEDLPDNAALYVLSLHMNKTIVLLKNGIWTTTHTLRIQDNNVKFVYLGDGVFMPIEINYIPMTIDKFPKLNTYHRKLKAMDNVKIHNHMTPVRTRKHTLNNCRRTRSLCKRVGNKWELKAYKWIKNIIKHPRRNVKEKCLTFLSIL